MQQNQSGGAGVQAEHSRLLLATFLALGDPLVLADSHAGHSTKPSTRKERMLHLQLGLTHRRRL